MLKKRYYRLSYISVIVNAVFVMIFLFIGWLIINDIRGLLINVIAVTVGIYNLLFQIPVSIIGIIFSIMSLYKKEVSRKMVIIPLFFNVVYIICYILVLLSVGKGV